MRQSRRPMQQLRHPPAAMRHDPVQAGRMKLDLARWLSDSTSRARRGDDATRGLREVGVRNAVVVLDYEGNRSQWQVPEASLDLEHRKQRSVIAGSARVAGNRGPWAMSFRFEDSDKTGNIELTTTIRDLVPSVIGQGVSGVVAAWSLSIYRCLPTFPRVLSTDGDVQTAKVAMELGAGRFGLPGMSSAPAQIDAGTASSRLQWFATVAQADAVHREVGRESHHADWRGECGYGKRRPCRNGDLMSSLRTACSQRRNLPSKA